MKKLRSQSVKLLTSESSISEDEKLSIDNYQQKSISRERKGLDDQANREMINIQALHHGLKH